MILTEICPVCGSSNYSYNEVLWPDLVADWELSLHEIDYINQQQGIVCLDCCNNLRSMALAFAIIRSVKFFGNFVQFVGSDVASSLSVLEINEAGGLSSILADIPGHKLIQYPEYNMEGLSIDPEKYDMVVHSDSLEHIPDPVLGLMECHRVLKPGGSCIYTVPLVVGRLSRSRQGMKHSYHGRADGKASDCIVHTEFGADAWKYPIDAGFSTVIFHSFNFPAALAIEAVK